MLPAAAPNLSQPTILHPADISTNQTLLNHLTTFIIAVFAHQERDPLQWDLSILRFSSPGELLDMLGKDGFMSVIFDESYSNEEECGNGDGRRGKIVACAGAIPFRSGDDREGKHVNVDGAWGGDWEIKTVCVDWDDRYAKKGLAIRCIKGIEEYLVSRREMDVKVRGDVGRVGGVDEAPSDPDRCSLTLWVRTEECLNGAYWRRRGFVEVEKKTVVGIWGCRTSFELATFRRDVRLHVEEEGK
jgi:hypothetical protein